MKVRFALLRLKCNFDKWIQCLYLSQRMVTLRVKRQTINSWGKIFTLPQQLRATAILIGTRRGDQPPISGRILFFQPHWQLASRFAINHIEDVS